MTKQTALKQIHDPQYRKHLYNQVTENLQEHNPILYHELVAEAPNMALHKFQTEQVNSALKMAVELVEAGIPLHEAKHEAERTYVYQFAN